MMQLFGNDACTECRQAYRLLESMGYQFEYIDVSTIPGYEGIIPRLLFDSGAAIVGLGRIARYVREGY